MTETEAKKWFDLGIQTGHDYWRNYDEQFRLMWEQEMKKAPSTSVEEPEPRGTCGLPGCPVHPTGSTMPRCVECGAALYYAYTNNRCSTCYYNSQ